MTYEQKKNNQLAWDTDPNEIKNPNLVTNSAETHFIMLHRNIYSLFPILVIVLIFSCKSEKKSDAYGNFEAVSVTVSAEGNGKLISFKIEEGKQFEARQQVGLIDTIPLHLEKSALLAKLDAIDGKLQEAAPEIAVLLKQKQNAVRERDRAESLYKEKAATLQQLDQLNGQVDLLDQQINSTTSRIGVANRGIVSERMPIQAQIDIINEHILRNQIINPIEGTVLTKIREEFEFVSTGTPLYKIASLNTLRLRAYTSASLLQKTKLNDVVTVLIDAGEKGYKQLEGRISWISSEAEFTPKTIETKEERVNLVYALYVDVINDGTLKIGMPGEVEFGNRE